MSRVEKGGTRFKPQIRPRAGIRSSQPGPSAPASSLESAQPGSLSQSVGPQAQPQAQAEAEAEAEAQAEAQAQAQPQSQSQSKEPHSMGGARGASRYPFAAEEEDEEEDRLPTTASSSKSQLLPIIASKSGRNVNVSASATNRAPKAIPAPTAPSPSPSPPPQARPALASAQSREPQSNGGTGALPPQPPAAEAAAIGESRDGRHGQTDGQAGAALDKSGGAKSKGDDMSSKDRGAVASSAGDRSSATPAPSAAAASARLRGMSATPMPESLSRRESMAPPEIASARKAREASVLSEAGIRGATPARVQAPTSPVVARGDGAATLERGALSGIDQGEAPAKRPRGRPKKAGAAAAAAAAAVSVPQHQEQETSADGSRKSRSRAEIVSPLRPESTSQAHLDGDAEEQAQEDSDDSAEEYFPSTTARRGRGGGRTRGGAGTRQSTKDASVSAHSVPESGKSKRRAKLKLPDDAPKRPANAYMRFSAQQRALHWADQNGASFGEVAQKIAERWAEVSAAEKGERAQMAKQELEAWRMNMVQWKRDNPEWAEKLDARKRKMGTVTDGETADEGATTDASAGATERKATKTPRKRSVRKPTHGEGSDSEAAGSTKRRRGGGGGKRKNVGISDDESAYAAELAAVGGNERLLEVSQGTRMADLSQPEVRMGRAGARTFELRRTYRKMVKDRKKELPERRMLAARKDKGSLRAEEVEEEERRKRSSKSLSTARKEVQQAQNEDEVQEEEVFDLDSDGEPIAPSSPAGSASPAPSGFSNNSSAHALKNNKNSVQVRMSNGRLVLDESTLQVDRAAEYEGEDRIVIEENEKDKFINSASFSDRRGHQRWDKEQTLAFYAAVSQWGTDFEMIARMFPSRTRKEIKQKWTSEERRNAHMIDAAFARRLPVDLQSYGEIAGVDLSGPPPVIKARTPPPIDFNAVNLKSKKKEGDEEEVVGEDEEARSERELGPNGEEIVEEGEDPIDAKFALSQERSKRNTSATPSVGAATQSGAESSAAGSDVEAVTEGEDDEDLPESTALLKRKRATSNASEGSASASVPTISRPRAGSTTSATSAQTRRRAGSSSAPAASTSGAATAAGAKQRKTEAEKKRAERDSRQEREKRHRRNVPDVGEEEVVGVIEPQTRRQVPRRG
ncbi:transcription initiation factor bdp1 subunit [Ceraceosorus bombacis]|uniref:Transcription initiation factor bdp1 subunit n=1 Tax=Ceraceosorus bombacis TaxID=401625 RepID=A0A0N7L9X1_9BASI|nr:transcription initiation factor bdp1 subunit [Ceraceosorus bombacis]